MERPAWSGRVGPLLVTPGSASEIRRVEVFRGPLDIGNTTGLYVEADDTAEADPNVLTLTFDTEPGDGVNTLLGADGSDELNGAVTIWP